MIPKLLVIVFCIGLVACGGESKTEVLLECRSPDGKSVAVFYREFGGGAAGWQYEAVAVNQPDDHTPSKVLKLKGGLRSDSPLDRSEATRNWISRFGAH